MLKVNTLISNVNVFRNGGEVIRKGMAELTKGKQTLEIYSLSSSAMSDTVRILSTDGLLCSNIRFAENDDEDRESLKLEEEIAVLNKKMEAINLQISLWSNNGDFSSRQSVNMNEVEEYIEKLPERIEQLQLRVFETQKEINKLQKQLEEVSQKEDDLVIIVDVYCEKEGTYPIEVRYHENNMSWNPVYEIQTDGKNTLKLLTKASIKQWTSEDFKDVDVSLYTGNPSANHVLPDIRPRYLNIEVPQPRPAKFAGMAMMASRNMVMEEETMMADAEVAPVMMTDATVKNEETMSEYILPDRKDIFKNEEVIADLERYDVNTVFKIVTVPKKDPHAYLVATIKSNELPIKEAISAGIYLNGIYTNNVYLDPDLTEEETDISLGREEKIFVKYRLASKKNSNVLLKGLKCSEYVYETTLANKTDNDVEIIIKDQLPVSQDKTITVEKLNLDNYECNDETGILSKKVSLKAMESLSTSISYKVSWPKDKNIAETSANRRFCPTCGSPVYGKFCPECGSTVD